MIKKILLPITVILLATILIFSGCTTSSSSCDSAASQLTDGSQISDSISANLFSKLYSVYVPSGTSSLTVVLDNLQADFDLYIGYGSIESLQGEDYDWRSNNYGTSSESITVSNPQEGCYYIQITDYSNVGGSFSLVANV